MFKMRFGVDLKWFEVFPRSDVVVWTRLTPTCFTKSSYFLRILYFTFSELTGFFSLPPFVSRRNSPVRESLTFGDLCQNDR